jgi:hypothetical protein
MDAKPLHSFVVFPVTSGTIKHRFTLLYTIYQYITLHTLKTEASITAVFPLSKAAFAVFQE